MTNRKRCERCNRPTQLCYCALITPIDNVWPVHILQHPLETRHALGTARIASLGLANCTLTLWERACSRVLESSHSPLRGQGPLPQDARRFYRGQGPLPQNAVLIYPGEDARPLWALAGEPPRPLVFIDATWRKSRRMLFESPELAALPRYALDSPPPSRYRIRKEPAPDALSTLEAIVFTLEQLEEAEARYRPLLSVMDTLIEQQIQRMGRDTFARNYDGCVPEGE